ncbi:MAG: 4Fe-4S binding protein [Clostridiales Family XIII bacterium]|nr:4Fe-4S binding protein [Clostridiales Family XIII bacterium]
MSEIDYATLKKGGFMRQRQQNRFSLRLRIIGGQVTAEKLRKISEVAEKYGHGYVHMTSRQGIEIPFIDFDDIDAVKDELALVELQPGACGPRVRTVTACQGADICPSGLIETSRLAEEVDLRYFGRALPHKFKIGITGCKNNCLKAEENDIGIKGGALPAWAAGKCTFCGLCTAVCPTKAIAESSQTLTLLNEKCIYCGKCAKSCPADAWSGQAGYILSFGGTFGNEIRAGTPLLPIIFSKAQMFAVIDAAVAFYDEYGKAGERFAKTIERTGAELLRGRLEREIPARV